MTDDVHRLLQRADGGPGTPDHTHIRARGRRLLRTRRGAMAGAGTLLAAGLVAVVTSMPASSPPAPGIGERSPSPSTAPQDTTDGCERPALSPTYLPWLEEGEAVPDPVHATSGSLSSPDALSVWARHPDQFDLHGPVHTDTLAIATLAEPSAWTTPRPTSRCSDTLLSCDGSAIRAPVGSNCSGANTTSPAARTR